MTRYVEPTEQLVTEIVVSDIKRSVQFNCLMGFAILRDGGDFVELTWEDHRLFLAELSAAFREVDRGQFSVLPKSPRANIRVMVPDVDKYWSQAIEIGAHIVSPIADRDYGLRDFLIADPDGFGVRFASELTNPSIPRLA
jgi:catechol 2,3-dioxygenase-like lactoylglutathione lyase family enzyme